MLNEESRQRLYQEYVTTGIKIFLEAFAKVHGGDITLPSFIEMTHSKQPKQSPDKVIEHLKEVFS